MAEKKSSLGTAHETAFQKLPEADEATCFRTVAPTHLGGWVSPGLTRLDTALCIVETCNGKGLPLSVLKQVQLEARQIIARTLECGLPLALSDKDGKFCVFDPEPDHPSYVRLWLPTGLAEMWFQ